METICYKDQTGFIRRFKVSEKKEKNFKVGDRFIVVGVSKKPEVVESDYRAKRLNESIVNDIRLVLE